MKYGQLKGIIVNNFWSTCNKCYVKIKKESETFSIKVNKDKYNICLGCYEEFKNKNDDFLRSHEGKSQEALNALHGIIDRHHDDHANKDSGEWVALKECSPCQKIFKEILCFECRSRKIENEYYRKPSYLKDLNFSAIARSALHNTNIKTLGEFKQMTEEDILNIKNLSSRVYSELLEKLSVIKE